MNTVKDQTISTQHPTGLTWFKPALWPLNF